MPKLWRRDRTDRCESAGHSGRRAERRSSACDDRENWREFGRFDILVNNAGVTHWVKLSDLEGLTDAIWDEILDVNVKGAFRCARAAAKLLEANQGMIVNVSSISGVLAPSTMSSLAYGTAKAALIYMTQGSRGRDGARSPRELRRAGVHRHAVDEPALRRRIISKSSPSVRRLSVAAHRHARRIAGAILGLITGGDFVTGQTLIVDGGLSLS